MTEARKISIGVLGGVLGIAILFAIAVMVVGKGDEPISYPEPIPAQPVRPLKAEAELPVAPIEIQQPVGQMNSRLAFEEAQRADELRVRQSILAKLEESQLTADQTTTSAPTGKPSVPVGEVSAPAAKAEEPTPSRPLAQSESDTTTGQGRTPASRSSARRKRTYRQTQPTFTPTEGAYGTTVSGIPTYIGPRGGVYHYSPSGNKVYERRR
jgi:hypothetical protein